MKVLQFVNTLSAEDGGPARNSFDLNLAFNRAPGHSADLFWIKGDLAESVIRADDRSDDQLPFPGPMRIKVGLQGYRTCSLRQLRRSVLAADVVVVHGYYLWWTFAAGLFGRILGKPVFCMPHGALTLRQQKYARPRKAIFDATIGRMFRRSLSAFIAGSSVERTELKARFSDVPIKVAGVGVGMPKEYKTRARVHEPVRLVCVSRIAPKKRVDLAIRTVRQLQEMGVEAVLYIAGSGDGELESFLRDLGEKLGVSDRVIFLGHIDTSGKHTRLLGSDFFLLPSEDENFGIGFAEAVAHGLPAIVSKDVAASVNYPSWAGTVLTDCTPRNMALEIVRLSEGHVYAAAVEGSRKFAMDNFSWGSAVEKWVVAMQTSRVLKRDTFGRCI